MLVYKFPYRIAPKGQVPIPNQSGTLTYNTYSQSPTWNNYDSTKMTLTGDTSGINARNYTAIFTLDSHYIWSDGTKGAKNIVWNIAKAPGNITLSKDSVSLTTANPTDTITFSNNTGTVSVVSADTSIATTSISGNTITITQA